MQIRYQSPNYTPERVTGRYVRVQGKRGKYTFIVFETATGTGRYAGIPGAGGTLREYVTTGEELPEELKEKCIKDKTTLKWD